MICFGGPLDVLFGGLRFCGGFVVNFGLSLNGLSLNGLSLDGWSLVG